MVVIVGCLVVCGCVLGGFMWAGGHIEALIHPSEVLTIGGASMGALIVMSSPAVLKGLVKGIIQALKGSPYSKRSYEETFSALLRTVSNRSSRWVARPRRPYRRPS